MDDVKMSVLGCEGGCPTSPSAKSSSDTATESIVAVNFFGARMSCKILSEISCNESFF